MDLLSDIKRLRDKINGSVLFSVDAVDEMTAIVEELRQIQLSAGHLANIDLSVFGSIKTKLDNLVEILSQLDIIEPNDLIQRIDNIIANNIVPEVIVSAGLEAELNKVISRDEVSNLIKFQEEATRIYNDHKSQLLKAIALLESSDTVIPQLKTVLNNAQTDFNYRYEAASRAVLTLSRDVVYTHVNTSDMARLKELRSERVSYVVDGKIGAIYDALGHMLIRGSHMSTAGGYYIVAGLPETYNTLELAIISCFVKHGLEYRVDFSRLDQADQLERLYGESIVSDSLVDVDDHPSSDSSFTYPLLSKYDLVAHVTDIVTSSTPVIVGGYTKTDASYSDRNQAQKGYTIDRQEVISNTGLTSYWFGIYGKACNAVNSWAGGVNLYLTSKGYNISSGDLTELVSEINRLGAAIREAV